MANRQHGKNRSPGSGRAARVVPVSRPLAGARGSGETWSQPDAPIYKEPEIRRWPHPLEDTSSVPAPEPALHYIRCALSYQNQLLADIKALLEQLAAAVPAVAEAPAPADFPAGSEKAEEIRP